MRRPVSTAALVPPSMLPADLVNDHGPAVWALCRRLSPDPEDAYQDVWEKVLAKQSRFDPRRGSLRTWVLTVAHRRLVDRHRRRKVRGPVMPLAVIPAIGPGADELVADKRARDHLERALAQLPDAQRRAVVSHHIHGLTLNDLAAAEGVSVGTIKSRLHRGRAALAQLLEGRDDR